MLKDWTSVTVKGKMKFRMLSLMMALALVLSIFPSGAMAEPAPESDYLKSLSLATNTGNIPENKVKVLIDWEVTPTSSTYLAIPAEEVVAVPEVGTQYSEIAEVFSLKLLQGMFVPAAPGETISVVEVDVDGEVIGYTTLLVKPENIGTVEALVDRGYRIFGLIKDQHYTIYKGNLFEGSYYHLTYSNLVSSDESVVKGVLSFDYITLQSINTGTAILSVDVTDNRTGEKITKTIPILVAEEYAPDFYENSEMRFFESEIEFHFQHNEDWLSQIYSIEVNNVEIPLDSYTIKESTDNNWSKMVFNAGVLKAEHNDVLIKANGYTNAHSEIWLHEAKQSYYTKEPLIDKKNGGLSASVQILRNNENNSYSSVATAVFQLMNGNIPVETVSFTTNELSYYHSFRAHFNLADATTNPNYSVKAFIITGDNLDDNNLGFNLVTTIDAERFDELFAEWNED